MFLQEPPSFALGRHREPDGLEARIKREGEKGAAAALEGDPFRQLVVPIVPGRQPEGAAVGQSPVLQFRSEERLRQSIVPEGLLPAEDSEVANGQLGSTCGRRSSPESLEPARLHEVSLTHDSTRDMAMADGSVAIDFASSAAVNSTRTKWEPL